MTRYHMTVVFENINDLHNFAKAMILTDIGIAIKRSKKELREREELLEVNQELVDRIRKELENLNKDQREPQKSNSVPTFGISEESPSAILP